MANIIKLETKEDYDWLIERMQMKITSLESVIKEQQDLKLALHKQMRSILDAMLKD